MNFFTKLKEKLERYERECNFTCDVCEKEVFSNERICSDCMASLPFLRGACCPLCGRAVKEEGICLECKQKPLSVHKVRSVFLHEGEAAHLVLRFKMGEKYLRFALSQLLLPLQNRQFEESELIVGVPMTEKSQKRRGYNQSYLLARELARLSGKEYLEVCVKKRETEAQKTLNRREREENLKGCFSVTDRKAVKGKSVLIVDDAFTTGSTLSELAETYKRAGASKVDGITLTSVPQKVFEKQEKKT